MSITPSPDNIVPILKREMMLNLLSKDIRADGRKPQDFRQISVEIGYAKKANGSALVRIGDTAVLAGVKSETREPFDDMPDQGNLIISVEFPPIASESFELGPPDENAIEISRVVDRSIRDSKSIDLTKLCIIPGKRVWNVWVDIYVLDHGGNILDASTMAAVLALYNAKLPKVVVEGDQVKTDNTIMETQVPIRYPVVSVSVCKIGNKLIVDPTIEEESICESKMAFSYLEDGKIVGIQKFGSGVFEVEELDRAEKMARETSKALLEELKKYIEIKKEGQ